MPGASPPHLTTPCPDCRADAGEACDGGPYCPCRERIGSFAVQAQSGEELLEELLWQSNDVASDPEASPFNPVSLSLPWFYKAQLATFGPLDRRWIPNAGLRRIRDLLHERAGESRDPEAGRIRILASEFDPDGGRQPSKGLTCRNPHWLPGLRNSLGSEWIEVPGPWATRCPWGNVDSYPPPGTLVRTPLDYAWRSAPWPVPRLRLGWPTPDHVIEELLAAGSLEAEHRAALADHIDRIMPERRALEIEAEALTH